MRGAGIQIQVVRKRDDERLPIPTEFYLGAKLSDQ